MAIVYTLRNPMKIDSSGRNNIFYVGMSFNDDVNDRPMAHLKESRSDDSYNPHKNRTIQNILKSGLEVEIEILYVGIDNELASELEIFLISFLGRRCAEKRGILCNIGKGGEDKCTGDKSLRKDTTGNKGNYIRTRACCIICRMETITAKINPHYKSAHE